MGPRRNALALVPLLALAALSACGGDPGDSGGSGAPRADSRSGSTSSAPPPTVKVEAPAPEDAKPGAPGSVHGVVRFEGAPPKREPLAITASKGCEHGDSAPLSEAVIVSGDKLLNCIVYVSKGVKEDAGGPAPSAPLELEQLGCIYRPHVAAARVGQKVVVHNADPTSHNVHVYAKRTTVPNRTQPAGGQDLEIVFDKAEMPVQVGCDIHPWMRAWLGVFDHPFFAVTGDDGAFRIEGLPPGHYTITAWHETLGKRTAELELPAGASAELDFAFAAK